MNTDEERDDKLKELEDKLENALERIDELEDGISEEESFEQQDSIQIESAGEAPFRVHWIDPSVETSVSCGDIDTVKKAQDAFAEANVYRNANAHRIMHGDVLILMCNYASESDACYYVGLCVVTNTPNQVEVPASPDLTSDSGTKEFMAWFTCPGDADCACDGSAEELISGGIDESSPDTSWKVSLGACVWYNQLMSVSIYSHTSAGTNLLTKTRAFTLNKCGEIINIGKEVENQILIPCECADDDCPASADECLTSNGITDASTYTLTDNSTGLQGNAGGGPYTLTRPMGNCIVWEHSSSGWTLTRSFSGTASPCPSAGVVTYTDPADPFYGPITFYNSGTSSSIPGTYTSSSNGSVVIS